MLSGKQIKVFALIGAASLAGCSHTWGLKGGAACKTCEPCEQQACCEADPCGECETCCGAGGCLQKTEWALFGWMCRKSNAIPDTLPLGSTVRAHDQVMQTNAEAADFILYRHQFVGQTAELTPDGKDHILEIAARMRSAPFPVIVEREENNSDPELDALRRNLVAQILTDLGNPDGQQRTVVGIPYGPGYTGHRGEMMYYQHIYRGGGFGNNGNNSGNNGGGFGGGGGGGGGFF